MRRILLPLALAALCQGAEPRRWTDTRQRVIEAELLRVEDRNVVLKLKDGREVRYPLDQLSQADRDHVGQIAGKPDAPDFDAPWPERVAFTGDPEIATIREDAEKKIFIYESANYRYASDVRLAKSVVKGFALLFESTHLFCRTLPLGMSGGQKTDGKYLILLFETRVEYIKAGGPPTSAGVFIGGRGIVMAPLEDLGVRKVGSGYMFDREKTNKTLPHELAHQLTPVAYFAPGSIGWFTEGIAEYVSTTPYRSGTYHLRANPKEIVEYVTADGADHTGGWDLGDHIELPALESLFLQSYADFSRQGVKGYGISLLLTHYFLHMDGAGDGKRLRDFLKALHEEKPAGEALTFLLDGRTYGQLQKEIAKAWSAKGITLAFDAK